MRQPRVSVRCPSCGIRRRVSASQASAIRRGDYSGACPTCAPAVVAGVDAGAPRSLYGAGRWVQRHGVQRWEPGR